MAASPDIENVAAVCRVTCGWRLGHLDLAKVRRFWRDVHSPAIARRNGVYEYRHNQFAAVRADVFTHIDGISYACPENAQLQWQSDVRYRNQAGLDAFSADPDGEVKRHLLGDIDMIVDRSTTYLVIGENARTFIDITDDAAPQGPPKDPSFAVFIRQRGGQAEFRGGLTAMAGRWAATPGVRRLRLNLFEAPDLEAERRGGYPIKTHPLEQQYQAWIDLSVESEAVTRGLMSARDDVDYAAHIAEIHAYPVDVVYTFNYGGRPTLTGLRGYCAYEAIGFLDALQHREAGLLAWMYGDVVAGGPVA